MERSEITLVVLVITIIILLILFGVVINSKVAGEFYAADTSTIGFQHSVSNEKISITNNNNNWNNVNAIVTIQYTKTTDPTPTGN